MTANDGTFDAEMSDEGIVTFTFPTTLDALNAPKLKGQCIASITNGVTGVLIDLTMTTFMDSSGIGVLVHLYQITKEKQLPITLIGTTGQPLKLVQSLQIDKVIPLK